MKDKGILKSEDSRSSKDLPGKAGTIEPVELDPARLVFDQLTAEQSAEQNRRLSAIAAGRHPDTGKKLRPGDEKSFNAIERLTIKRQWRLGSYGPDFVRRLLGSSGHDLLRQAVRSDDTPNFDRLCERVDAAAARKIVELWKEMPDSTKVVHNRKMICAEYLVKRYGARIVDQTEFLREYHRNLSNRRTLVKRAMLEADAMSRSAFPAGVTPFEVFDPSNVGQIQDYGRSIIETMRKDFVRERNPVIAWEALAACRRYGLVLPDWVLEYLTDSANRMVDILDAVRPRYGSDKGQPENATQIGKERPERAPKVFAKEPDAAGKALGFSRIGSTGFFARASELKGDRYLSALWDSWMQDERSQHPDSKPEQKSGLDHISKIAGVSTSSVRRALVRSGSIKK